MRAWQAPHVCALCLPPTPAAPRICRCTAVGPASSVGAAPGWPAAAAAGRGGAGGPLISTAGLGRVSLCTMPQLTPAPARRHPLAALRRQGAGKPVWAGRSLGAAAGGAGDHGSPGAGEGRLRQGLGRRCPQLACLHAALRAQPAASRRPAPPRRWWTARCPMWCAAPPPPRSAACCAASPVACSRWWSLEAWSCWRQVRIAQPLLRGAQHGLLGGDAPAQLPSTCALPPCPPPHPQAWRTPASACSRHV